MITGLLKLIVICFCLWYSYVVVTNMTHNAPHDAHRLAEVIHQYNQEHQVESK